jgi:hypothetical protein
MGENVAHVIAAKASHHGTTQPKKQCLLRVKTPQKSSVRQQGKGATAKESGPADSILHTVIMPDNAVLSVRIVLKSLSHAISFLLIV